MNNEVLNSELATRSVEEGFYAAALAALGTGPGRLRRLLAGHSPREAFHAIAAGEHPEDPDRVYEARATHALLEVTKSAVMSSSATVLVRGFEGYPSGLSEDPQAPAVLFAVGDPATCEGVPTVALVGTRSATPYGLSIARSLGKGLASAGVAVVSGLARGIDSSAHAGALEVDGPPVLAVLGTALDSPLAPEQEHIRRGFVGRGVLLSELVPGSRGAPSWWFALRNRVIAALSDAVVVVESHARGGALQTVKYAARRGIAVGAVPGSVRSAASKGTNDLLAGGARVVRDVDDVLSLLAAAAPTRVHDSVQERLWHTGNPTARDDASSRHRLTATNAGVLEALGDEPASVDRVAGNCGLALSDVLLVLEQLRDLGLAGTDGGWWWAIG